MHRRPARPRPAAGDTVDVRYFQARILYGADSRFEADGQCGSILPLGLLRCVYTNDCDVMNTHDPRRSALWQPELAAQFIFRDLPDGILRNRGEKTNLLRQLKRAKAGDISTPIDQPAFVEPAFFLR